VTGISSFLVVVLFVVAFVPKGSVKLEISVWFADHALDESAERISSLRQPALCPICKIVQI
jgi:hypothetical protein